jgi:hypothetical protein
MRLPLPRIQTRIRLALPALALTAGLAVLLAPAAAPAQTTPEASPHASSEPSPGKAATAASAPPASGEFFPLSEVHRGLSGTAWTVFTGTQPEPMKVEILGVLRGALGPGQDMILARLLGARPEYTGVVAGMSGSPVYIGNRLLGALSYRIGEFSKEPIAGITPIGQMLEVKNLPIDAAQPDLAGHGPALLSILQPNPEAGLTANGMNLPAPTQAPIQQMDTPLVMSGFSPEAIRLWQEKMTGTGLKTVAAGGMGGSSESTEGAAVDDGPAISPQAIASVKPGSAVSAQLVRGDMEIAATCTVTYIDRRQLLACGHPLLQAGPVSLPMTTAEVVATLASPMNSFKIVNTGATIGAFTEDRDAAIRGVLGASAQMIPVHIRIHEPGRERKLNVEVLDIASLTPQAVMVVVYQALIESNGSTAETSYHLTGTIDLDGCPPSPLNLWAPSNEAMAAPMEMALLAAKQFARLYSNGARQGAVRAVNLDVQAIPRDVQVELEEARLVSGDMVHAGDTVVVEATLRPWQRPLRNVRIAVRLPDRLEAGNLRMLVSDAGTLDRIMDESPDLARMQNRAPDLDTELSQARSLHAADRIYVSLLVPEAQAGVNGQTLPSLPLSVVNALEPLRASEGISLNGESAELAADTPAGGVLSGFEVLNLRIVPGAGLD